MHVRACKKRGPGDNFTGFANRTILQACSPGLFNLSIKKNKPSPSIIKIKYDVAKIFTDTRYFYTNFKAFKLNFQERHLTEANKSDPLR